MSYNFKKSPSYTGKVGKQCLYECKKKTKKRGYKDRQQGRKTMAIHVYCSTILDQLWDKEHSPRNSTTASLFIPCVHLKLVSHDSYILQTFVICACLARRGNGALVEILTTCPFPSNSLKCDTG